MRDHYHFVVFSHTSKLLTPRHLPLTLLPLLPGAGDCATHKNKAEVENDFVSRTAVKLAVLQVCAEFDKLVDLYLKPYPNRFQLWCGIETTDIDKPDYPERAAAELERCYRKGARGTGELSDKGWGYARNTNAPRDKRLHPDDPRLDLFWDKCAELKIPANIHVADHPSCWTPLDVYQERTPDYQHFSQWGKDVPSYQELIERRDRALARHPKTRFIACHLGNQGNDLATLSKALDRFPNLMLDISARDYEVGRAPRAAVKFLTRYRNRVMFGTDMGREKSMYQSWWRLFETADENMPGRVWGGTTDWICLPPHSMRSIAGMP